jgi:hypothetical protein
MAQLNCHLVLLPSFCEGFLNTQALRSPSQKKEQWLENRRFYVLGMHMGNRNGNGFSENTQQHHETLNQMDPAVLGNP